ncbi:sulfotransferase family protein [Rhabdothermincola sediminis]|uniref:sulfotransferase family protein n=1 Tax=Rhabdothermincola sediminis TaxID=2751370 RepID=UPI001AA03B6F|nr:sulfotransferase [Rhabdothermincola sediminis]
MDTPSPPAAVHLDDLADPRFPPEAAAIIEATAPLGATIDLNPATLCAQAVAETGLEDFGEPSFRERLRVLADALESEAGLSGMGRVTTSVQLVQLLKNRVLLEDLLARHPEIREERIDRPIIIAGLPRTGTTHLHNLLATDPVLRSLPYWESLEPFPTPEDAVALAAGAPDPRLARAEAGTAFLDLALPYFKRMHEMTPDHVHEEIQLLAMDFSSMLFETTAPMPSWREHYLAHDQVPHYEYLRTVLQALQFLRPARPPGEEDRPVRWVLKSPQHLEQFQVIEQVFPDATVLVTHRDPVSVTASMATMIAYTARLHLERVDPVAIGRYWADRLVRMLRACVDQRDVLPRDRSLDVRFDQFMADDLGTIERIYAVADQPLDDRARAAHQRYLASHQRDRHGSILYDLADFALDPSACRTATRSYTERFGIPTE